MLLSSSLMRQRRVLASNNDDNNNYNTERLKYIDETTYAAHINENTDPTDPKMRKMVKIYD